MPNQTSSRNHLSQRSRKIVEEIARQRSAEYRLVIRALFRIRFVYTPKHCSWLNQVEMQFSILVRRLLKRASFKSTDELRQRILAFIEYLNATLAKPFKWSYKGRPLMVQRGALLKGSTRFYASLEL